MAGAGREVLPARGDESAQGPAGRLVRRTWGWGALPVSAPRCRPPAMRARDDTALREAWPAGGAARLPGAIPARQRRPRPACPSRLWRRLPRRLEEHRSFSVEPAMNMLLARLEDTDRARRDKQAKERVRAQRAPTARARRCHRGSACARTERKERGPPRMHPAHSAAGGVLCHLRC